MEIKKCINQIFPPKSPYVPVKGIGDCRICTTDENNKYCTSYYPITIFTFEVKK